MNESPYDEKSAFEDENEQDYKPLLGNQLEEGEEHKIDPFSTNDSSRSLSSDNDNVTSQGSSS